MITINIAKILWKKLLRVLGFRSKCCDAPVYYAIGWSWKYDGYRCTKCDKAV